jgi:cytidylate kinase
MKEEKSRPPFVVTIDGPAGSGKSTVAKGAAERTGLRYLDTGKLYRALAYYLSENGIPPEESPGLKIALSEARITVQSGRVGVGGKDVTEFLHTSKIDGLVSQYAALPAIREILIGLQREQACAPGLIADGRDMGSVVFPLADLKIFLTADAGERAKRRFLEQSAKGEDVEYEKVLSIVISRDKTDSQREVAPLVIPENAIIIDTTEKNADTVISEVALLIEKARRATRNEEEKDVS